MGANLESVGLPRSGRTVLLGTQAYVKHGCVYSWKAWTVQDVQDWAPGPDRRPRPESKAQLPSCAHGSSPTPAGPWLSIGAGALDGSEPPPH